MLLHTLLTRLCSALTLAHPLSVCREVRQSRQELIEFGLDSNPMVFHNFTRTRTLLMQKLLKLVALKNELNSLIRIVCSLVVLLGMWRLCGFVSAFFPFENLLFDLLYFTSYFSVESTKRKRRPAVSALQVPIPIRYQVAREKNNNWAEKPFSD